MRKAWVVAQRMRVLIILLGYFGFTMSMSIQTIVPPDQLRVTWNFTELCVGGDNALTSTDVRFTYRYEIENISRTIEGPLISKNNVTEMRYNLSYPSSTDVNGGNNRLMQIEYFFEQLEHGGGFCNCLDISFYSFQNRLDNYISTKVEFINE